MGRKIIDFLLKPFGENLTFFLALWLLASAADTYYWSIHGNPVFGCYMAVHGFIQVYVIVLLCGFLRGKALWTAKIILILAGIVSMVADACVQRIMWFGFTGDMVAIIMGSNLSEASEFLPLYFNAGVMSFIAVVLAALLVLFLFRKRIDGWNKTWIKLLLFFGLLASVLVVCVRRSRNWEGVFLNKIGLFLSYQPVVDLAGYRQDVMVEKEEDAQPDNIVIIIGESLSRHHCSLYGYDKQTTPNLDAMAGDSVLVCYSNISAAFTNTVEAFVRMFSTFDNNQPQDASWFEYLFLEDAMTAAGYETVWISNQSSVGVADNVVAKLAALSDKVQWVGPKGMGIGKSNPDGDVLPFIRQFAREETEDKRFFVIHLMGSHAGFSTRYPASFARFTSEDYAEAPENQRQLLAEYDNSVLYGDWVVSEAMRLFDDTEAIVLFFPDHALDIYHTDADYIGHARTGNPESVRYGSEIPFVIYPTRAYRERFPEKVRAIREAQTRPFNLENLPYAVLDLAGVESVQGEKVKNKSFLP